MSAPADGFWNDMRCALLRELVASPAKYSAGDIAWRIGCSRNSAIGKIRRLGLELPGNLTTRPMTQKPHTPRKRRQQFMPKSKPNIGAIETLPGPQVIWSAPSIYKRVPDLDPGDCRWPLDAQGGGYMFCSAPATNGRSWCDAHCRVGLNPHAYSGALRSIPR